jgi:hypothetical protein
MPKKIICRYCKKLFIPSRYHPKQEVCPSEECQRRRKREYHRKKITEDSVYRQICADSRKNWRENNPDYQRQYRKNHEAASERNRQKQYVRNRRRRLLRIVKNNLAIDVTRSYTEVWTVSASLDAIVKNNMAFSQVIVLQADKPRRRRPAA